MTTKLTLTVEKSVIEKAKKYAKGTQRSLSEIVQKYLESLVEESDKSELSPKIKNLAGSLKLPENFDYDKALDDYYKDDLKNVYLIEGAAGSGKSTALKQVSLNLSKKIDLPIYFVEENKHDFISILQQLYQKNERQKIVFTHFKDSKNIS